MHNFINYLTESTLARDVALYFKTKDGVHYENFINKLLNIGFFPDTISRKYLAYQSIDNPPQDWITLIKQPLYHESQFMLINYIFTEINKHQITTNIFHSNIQKSTYMQYSKNNLIFHPSKFSTAVALLLDNEKSNKLDVLFISTNVFIDNLENYLTPQEKNILHIIKFLPITKYQNRMYVDTNLKTIMYLDKNQLTIPIEAEFCDENDVYNHRLNFIFPIKQRLKNIDIYKKTVTQICNMLIDNNLAVLLKKYYCRHIHINNDLLKHYTLSQHTKIVNPNNKIYIKLNRPINYTNIRMDIGNTTESSVFILDKTDLTTQEHYSLFMTFGMIYKANIIILVQRSYDDVPFIFDSSCDNIKMIHLNKRNVNIDLNHALLIHRGINRYTCSLIDIPVLNMLKISLPILDNIIEVIYCKNPLYSKYFKFHQTSPYYYPFDGGNLYFEQPVWVINKHEIQNKRYEHKDVYSISSIDHVIQALNIYHPIIIKQIDIDEKLYIAQIRLRTQNSPHNIQKLSYSLFRYIHLWVCVSKIKQCINLRKYESIIAKKTLLNNIEPSSSIALYTLFESLCVIRKSN